MVSLDGNACCGREGLLRLIGGLRAAAVADGM